MNEYALNLESAGDSKRKSIQVKRDSLKVQQRPSNQSNVKRKKYSSPLTTVKQATSSHRVHQTEQSDAGTRGSKVAPGGLVSMSLQDKLRESRQFSKYVAELRTTRQ